MSWMELLNQIVSEIEVDSSGSISSCSGVKKEKRDGGNSHIVSQYSESEGPSTYEHSLSFPAKLQLVSALKGGRAKSGEASPTKNLRVKWAPDVYDPPVTSVCHSVKSQQQWPRSRKKDKNKQKQKKRRLCGSRKGKKSCHDDDVHHLEAPGSSSQGELGEVETGILDYEMGCQEAKCGSSFVHESAGEMHLSAAEAS